MKKFLKVFAVLVLVVIVVLVMLPSEVHVERSIEINASAKTIFEQVNVFPNWQKWSPWAKADPDMESRYEGEEGVGSTHYWSSEVEEVGEGQMQIIESEEYSRIKTELKFKGMDWLSYGTWNFEENGDVTKVTWAMDADMGMNLKGRFFGLMMDGMVGPKFEQGLAGIREIAESMAEKAVIQVEEASIDAPIWYLGITDSVDAEGMKTLHETLFAELEDFMKENDIQEVSAPLAVYFSWDEAKTVLQCGVPVQDSVATTGRIEMGKIGPGPVVITTHYGEYENLEATHKLLNDWLAVNKITTSGPPWEVYLTNPGTESDVTKWETKIYYPVER